MRNFRRLVLGLLLVILCPLGWGEDVYYCEEEHFAMFEPASSSAYKLQKYKTSRFTLKYDADEHRLAIKGENWGGDELYFMDCDTCYPEQARFNAVDITGRFRKAGGRFFFVASAYSSAMMKTGTCTKF